MPIYAYRCGACGHAQDVLQKLSDPVLTTCPACGQEAYAKQVTAAGFQLKGSGWYVTDFRGGNTGAKPDAAEAGAGGDKVDAAADGKSDAKADAKPDAKPQGAPSATAGDKPAAAPAVAAPAAAAPAPAAVAAPAPGAGS